MRIRPLPIRLVAVALPTMPAPAQPGLFGATAAEPAARRDALTAAGSFGNDEVDVR